MGGSRDRHMRHGGGSVTEPLTCLGTAHCGHMCSASISSCVGPVTGVLESVLPIPALCSVRVAGGARFVRCRMRCRCASSWIRAVMVAVSVSGSSGWYALGSVPPVSSQLASLVLVGSVATSYMMEKCSFGMFRMMGLR